MDDYQYRVLLVADQVTIVREKVQAIEAVIASMSIDIRMAELQNGGAMTEQTVLLRATRTVHEAKADSLVELLDILLSLDQSSPAAHLDLQPTAAPEPEVEVE